MIIEEKSPRYLHSPLISADAPLSSVEEQCRSLLLTAYKEESLYPRKDICIDSKVKWFKIRVFQVVLF